MSKFQIKPNQAALIFDVSPQGEVTVDVAFHDHADDAGNLAASICTAIGQKLTEDESFQNQIMAMLEKNDQD